MQLWVAVFENLEHVAVPFELSLMVKSANHVNFGATVFRRFPSTIQDLFIRHRVAFVAAKVRSERTKIATIDANVRRVQVRVDVVIRRVAVFSLANQICKLAKIVNGNLGVVHQQPIVHRKTLSSLNLVPNFT